MRVREYSFEFNFLARYAPDIIRAMSARVHRYMEGLWDPLIKDRGTISLHDNIDISHI